MTDSIYTRAFLLRVLLKTALLFVLANVLFVIVQPAYGVLTIYNWLVPGRERLPFGENPAAYNLSLNNLDAMFASHLVARPKAPDEYRVLLIGDSATWGVLLRPDQTLAGQLNALDLRADDERRMVFYNLGYPTMSLTKDLMLMEYALRYQADTVIWLVTAQSFPRDVQLDPPLVQHSRESVRQLITTYDLALNPDDPQLFTPTLWDRTLVGSRRDLADWLRLQGYGLTYAATQIDQYYPLSYTPRTEDFDTDTAWSGSGFRIEYETDLSGDALAFDVLAAGILMLRQNGIDVILVNEPTFVSTGENSELRYNFFYPRWAYDQYRQHLESFSEAHEIAYLDVWDLIEGSEFTDSPVHLTPRGSAQLAARLSAQFTPKGRE
jgi:hypothetical protein